MQRGGGGFFFLIEMKFNFWKKEKIEMKYIKGNTDFSFCFSNLTHIFYVDCQKNPYRRTNAFNRVNYED